MPSTIKKDKEREKRFDNEVLVDAYGPEEHAMGWYVYIGDKAEFPFTAECRAKRAVSPLVLKEKVEVVGIAPEEECEHEIFVMIIWNGRKLAVPLVQLSPTGVSKKTKEAVEDWHYWVRQGYQF